MASSAVEELRRSLQGVDLDEPEAEKKGIELFKFDHVQRGWTLHTKSCEIGFYDASEGTTKDPVWFLEIPEDDIDLAVTDELNMQMNETERRVTFGSMEGVWAMRFPESDRFTRFRRIFFDKLFENMYGCENTEANQKEIFGKDLHGRLFTDSSAPMDWEVSDEEEEHQNSAKQNADEEAMKNTNSLISSMTMGIGGKSYLFRGNEVDVLSNAPGCIKPDEVSFKLSLSSGSTITPEKVLLGQHEKKMSILTSEHNNSLFHADVETGKVVTEWKFEKNGVDVPMVDIAAKCKGSQIEDDSTLLSLDKNRLCRWDMRDPSGVVQDMTATTVLDFVTGKDYSKGTNFTSIASAGDGSVAVGSADGRIRLYSDNQKLTRASTALTPIGVPITALDITHDGQWVVATTDGFLQVSKTTAKDDKNNVINGFKKSLSSRQAPPKLLKLKPEDQAIVGRHPFRNARFTFITEANCQERWIVASCGNYTILWNFRKVKVSRSGVKSHGGLTTITDYQMLEKAENVVDSSFMHDKYSSRNGGESLVVATKHHVYSTVDE